MLKFEDFVLFLLIVCLILFLLDDMEMDGIIGFFFFFKIILFKIVWEIIIFLLFKMLIILVLIIFLIMDILKIWGFCLFEKL